MEKKFISEGEIYVSEVPLQVITILGSCIAICMWDKKNKIGGMNHYLLPGKKEENMENTNRGNAAIPALVNLMIEKGGRKANMEAKIFGGCQSLYSNVNYEVGKKNIEMAVKILNELNIPIVAGDTGGKYGRKIIFNTGTGKVLMKLLNKTSKEIDEEKNKSAGL